MAGPIREVPAVGRAVITLPTAVQCAGSRFPTAETIRTACALSALTK